MTTQHYRAHSPAPSMLPLPPTLAHPRHTRHALGNRHRSHPQTSGGLHGPPVCTPCHALPVGARHTFRVPTPFHAAHRADGMPSNTTPTPPRCRTRAATRAARLCRLRAARPLRPPPWQSESPAVSVGCGSSSAPQHAQQAHGHGADGPIHVVAAGTNTGEASSHAPQPKPRVLGRHPKLL